MAGYHQKLQREIARRDKALGNVRLGASTGAAIAVDRLEQVQRTVRAEIFGGKAFIREQIYVTKDLVHREIDHAGDTVERQIDYMQDACNTQVIRGSEAVSNQLDRLKDSLNLKKIVRKHPWEATFAALLAGMMVVPLFAARGTTLQKEQKGDSGNRDHANMNDFRESLWTPVTKTLLEYLPALIEAFMRKDSKPSVDVSPTPDAPKTI